MTARSELLGKLSVSLSSAEAEGAFTPGLIDDLHRTAFLRQIVDSVQRNVVIESWVAKAEEFQPYADPNGSHFHPLKAALWFESEGNLEESFWLTFLFAHIGKKKSSGWTLLSRLYGALGSEQRWSWAQVTETPEEFRDWLDMHKDELKAGGAGFGNHRKYESLAGRSDVGTGAVTASYIDWSGSPPSQEARFSDAAVKADQDPAQAFNLVYDSLSVVKRFGRLGRFDYLRMVGRLKLADIEPGSAYLKGSTGPLMGATQLWGPSPAGENAVKWYEQRAATLSDLLGVDFDVVEDALCNWQKSPGKFKHFSG